MTLDRDHPVRMRYRSAKRAYGHGMGLFRHRSDEPVGQRFQMREKLVSIGDDYWIEDDQGRRVYKVNGKALRFRDTLVLEDTSGNEVARIRERKLSLRDKVAIERGGDTVATVRKALIGIRDRFVVEVKDRAEMKAHGNFVGHEYQIECEGLTVARISKKWFRVRESYGIEIAQGEDVPLILTVTVAIDSLA